jgi:hypothetical protein
MEGNEVLVALDLIEWLSSICILEISLQSKKVSSNDIVEFSLQSHRYGLVKKFRDAMACCFPYLQASNEGAR